MIVYAINVNSGGGKILLDELILSKKFGSPRILFLDQRYSFPEQARQEDYTIFRIKPSTTQRILAEFKLRKQAKVNKDTFVLCFGNLPPIFRLKQKTVVYLQNALLLTNVFVARDSLKLFVRNLVEKLWFKMFIRNADEIWVQTNWMKNTLNDDLKKITSIRPILPTFPVIHSPNLKIIDFISITGSMKYKNLIPLLEAIKLSQIKNKKFVVISDSKSKEVNQLLNEIKDAGINLDFYINIEREKIYDLLSQSKCLVLASTLESFCLPLQEAIHFQLDIIAGDFPFVKEHCEPTIKLNLINAEEVKKALLSYTSKKSEES